jgi:hypothetical protein
MGASYSSSSSSRYTDSQQRQHQQQQQQQQQKDSMSIYPLPVSPLPLQDTDAHRVAESILGPRSKPVLYAKHMAKHKVGLNQSLMTRATHMVGGWGQGGGWVGRRGGSAGRVSRGCGAGGACRPIC